MNTLLLSKIRIIIIIVFDSGKLQLIWNGKGCTHYHCNCLKMGEQSQSIELFISDFQNQGAHKQKSKFTKN